MPQYMTLFGFVPAAWAELAPDPKDRGHALGERLDRAGVQLVDLFQAYGGAYDGVALYDAADEATADAAATIIHAVSPGRGFQTIPLQSGEQPQDAVRRVFSSTADGHDAGSIGNGAATTERVLLCR